MIIFMWLKPLSHLSVLHGITNYLRLQHSNLSKQLKVKLYFYVDLSTLLLGLHLSLGKSGANYTHEKL